jgi:hypothetical protein
MERWKNGKMEKWNVELSYLSSELTHSSLPSFNTCACVVAPTL